jgi:hypothetical protein
MMKLPDFLSLASLGHPDSSVILAGDHRQLAPIVAHDWLNEDRPPTVLYKPYVSAYDAVHQIAQLGGLPREAVHYSALSYTFRLPAVIRELIARIYRLDDIELVGADAPVERAQEGGDVLRRVWDKGHGIYVFLHNEVESRRSNRLEAAIIRTLLEAGERIPQHSVAIITPHRAQRGLLKDVLRTHTNVVSMIDTVERLQGGERPTVIVSATASDPSAISANAEFLLNLNRANVAFSRAQARLIVVCSQSLLEHVPAEMEQYESALLWKALRSYCTRLVGEVQVHGHRVRVLEPPH